MRVLRVSHSAVVTAWRARERELRRAGVDVRLLSARAWDEGGTRVPLEPARGEAVAGIRTVGTHPALFVYDPRPLWRALGQHWDAIDIHEEPFALATAEILALRWLRRRRPPYMLYSAQNIAKRYPWPFRAFETLALRGAAAVSVCNDDAGRIARAKGARGVVETIPLGVDLDAFSPAEPIPAAAPDSDAIPETHSGRVHEPDAADGPVVGYVGRLAEHKGVAVLLNAVADDDRLRLRIAGAGPQENELRARAAPLGDRVEFAGSLADTDLADFYRSLDVLAVPSLTTPAWIEQFGRVAVEAMACGIPVVASNSGALPDVVAGAGILVPPGDPAALREALLRVGIDPALQAHLGATGRRRAEGCSWPAVADAYHRLYEKIVDTTKYPTDTRDSAHRGVPRARVGYLAAEVPPEVIVVAYGGPDLVRAAITPLAGRMPITVVDNSSLPEIRTIADELGARYLDPGRNGGFAAGVNHGLAHRQSPGSDVLLLNPDAIVTPDDVTALHRGLIATGAASAGPRQVDADGVAARVAWPYPSPLGTWVEAVGLARLRRTRPERSFVIGSVLLLSADAIEEIGGFDERFFLYAEETDWAYRATLAGWRHVVVPESSAIHLGGATSSDPARREAHFHTSQERYLRKHYGAAGWHVARAGAVAGAAARSVALRGQRRSQARRRAALYLRGPVRAEHELTAR